MKKILIAVLILGLFCGACYIEHNYTRTDCEVIEASSMGALIEDRCGFTWYYEGEGFEVGDLVDLKMHDNFTSSNIDDDEIKKVVRAE